MIAFALSNWRMLLAAGLAAVILFQHVEIISKNAEIAQIRDAQVEAVNKQLTDNAARESVWHKAITAGFQNYQIVNDHTRSTYEKQLAQLNASSSRRMQPVSHESGSVPANSGATDPKACEDRLAAARAAAAGCVDAARAANECEARLELMWNGWPK